MESLTVWEAFLKWVEVHPGLASWVQAFGSIVAIAVAIRLSGSERRYKSVLDKRARVDAIERSIQASQFALNITTNTLEFFTCNSIARSMIPRFIRVIDQASNYVDESRASQSVDSQISAAMMEVKNALVDIRSLTSAWADNEEDDYSHELEFFNANIRRITNAIINLLEMKADALRRLKWWWPSD
ncbi:hypothetical protein GIV23_12045 [Pseudomonas sp. PA-1-2A]|uniref:hypothetical protein n=1 Tax=Pseudomonas TaxID=286 RepID=UPI001475A2EC|nr:MULTISPECIES: hypothetical protein [Pseudomonas]MCF5691106.1 hypothetical protein [Pseudomonas sp. PA-1-8C]MCF5790501.1 hypothetical protein [Pseudomonas sp. PA-1-6G]MCF5791506.1 hypothetical protein [Pseudomonas sp. PA-1-6B]MCF5800765.1 hypothetical protein [Pseudomonas sp. PA-1-5A]MCF5814040.1 hypothetical protein [Pseudomonas sp. PA-1-2A]